MIGIKKLIKAAEELNWTVSKDGNDYGLQKFSDYGQDFNIYISGKTAKSLIDELELWLENFDISEAAYIWLDSSGHGKNGAPHDMIDVYKDMEQCSEMAEELLAKWKTL